MEARYYNPFPAVRTCERCGGPLTVVKMRERVRRPFQPDGVAVVMRERLCERGPDEDGRGCGARQFSEEHVVSFLPPPNDERETND